MREVLAAAGLSVTVLSVGAQAAEIVVAWTGAGGDHRWANPLNWSPNVVPINNTVDQYVVRIQSGSVITIDSSLPPTFAESTLEIASGRVFQINGGRSVSVVNASGVNGQVRLAGGSQFLIQPAAVGTVVSPMYRELLVSEGSRYTHALGTLSLDNPFASSSGSGLHVTGDGSSGDFRNVTSIAPNDDSASFFPIRALNGGSIDFPSQTSFKSVGSTRWSFLVDRGTINLASLASAQRNQLEARDGGNLNLPSLSSINNADVFADYAEIALPLVTSVVSTGSVFKAGGLNGRLSLPSLTSVTLDNATSSGTIDFIARTGGVLSLPALTSAAMGNLPSTRGVTFTVFNGSRLELPSSTGVIGQGMELVAFEGGAIGAPQLTGTLNRARISATSDGVISVPLLAGLVNSSVALNNQRTGFGNFLTNIDGTCFSIQGNSSVTLGNVEGTVSDTPERGLAFRVGAGVFSLPVGTSLSTRPSNHVEMSASLGRLEFPVPQSITGGARSIGTNFSLPSGVVSYSPRALPVLPILSITSTGATATFPRRDRSPRGRKAPSGRSSSSTPPGGRSISRGCRASPRSTAAGSSSPPAPSSPRGSQPLRASTAASPAWR